MGSPLILLMAKVVLEMKTLNVQKNRSDDSRQMVAVVTENVAERMTATV